MPGRRRILALLALLAVLWALVPASMVSADTRPGISTDGCVVGTHVAYQSDVAGWNIFKIRFRLQMPEAAVVAGRWEMDNGAKGFMAWWQGPGDRWLSPDFSVGTQISAALTANVTPGSSGIIRFVLFKTGDYGGCFQVSNVVVERFPSNEPSGGPPAGGGGGFATPSPTPTGAPTPTPAPTAPACAYDEPPDFEGCDLPEGQCFGFGPQAPGSAWPIVDCEALATPSPTPSPTPGPTYWLTCDLPSGSWGGSCNATPEETLSLSSTAGDSIKMTFRAITSCPSGGHIRVFDFDSFSNNDLCAGGATVITRCVFIGAGSASINSAPVNMHTWDAVGAGTQVRVDYPQRYDGTTDCTGTEVDLLTGGALGGGSPSPTPTPTGPTPTPTVPPSWPSVPPGPAQPGEDAGGIEVDGDDFESGQAPEEWTPFGDPLGGGTPECTPTYPKEGQVDYAEVTPLTTESLGEALDDIDSSGFAIFDGVRIVGEAIGWLADVVRTRPDAMLNVVKWGWNTAVDFVVPSDCIDDMVYMRLDEVMAEPPFSLWTQVDTEVKAAIAAGGGSIEIPVMNLGAGPMAYEFDINDTIGEVETAVAPYREILGGMIWFLGVFMAMRIVVRSFHTGSGGGGDDG